MANDWRAAMHFLERRFPERWSLKQAGEDAQPRHEVIVVHHDQLSEEERSELAKRSLAQRSPSDDSS
jgi:hypothetical protein